MVDDLRITTVTYSDVGQMSRRAAEILRKNRDANLRSWLCECYYELGLEASHPGLWAPARYPDIYPSIVKLQKPSSPTPWSRRVGLSLRLPVMVELAFSPDLCEPAGVSTIDRSCEILFSRAFLQESLPDPPATRQTANPLTEHPGATAVPFATGSERKSSHAYENAVRAVDIGFARWRCHARRRACFRTLPCKSRRANLSSSSY
jgi:hypothetical protein